MNEEDRKLFSETVNVMNGLRLDMQEFRGEMREFKQQSLVRITSLETDQVECQKHPSVCATARMIESHISGHKGGKRLAVSIWAVCGSTVMCIVRLDLAVF